MSAINVFFNSSSFWAIFLTILTYLIAVKFQRILKTPLCNPILVAVVLLILILKITGIPNGDYQSDAKYLNYLLTPATICLGLTLYEQFEVLKKNIWAVFIGAFTGAIFSLLFVLLLAYFFRLDRVLTISLLPKSITSAMGLALSEEAGGIGAITTMAIIVTGIFGNICGFLICKLFRINNPIAQGTAFGTASHIIGTAKVSEHSELMGAVSSISLIIAGLATAIVYPIILLL